MSYNSNDFLSAVDPQILFCGKAVYEDGLVQKLTKDDTRFCAKVEGDQGKSYTVTLCFANDGTLGNVACTCPHDSGEVCKHTVAALLAIEHGDYKEKKPNENAKKAGTVSLDTLVTNAAHETLAALVIAQADSDSAFYHEVLHTLGAPAELQLNAAKTLVKESIRRNTRRGDIDYHGCDCICTDMDKVLDTASHFLTQHQPEDALSFARYILLTCIKLASTADSSSGSLSYTINTATELISQSVLVLSDKPAVEKRKQLDELLKDVKSTVFDGWDEVRYDLLRQAACLVDDKSAKKLYNTMDALLTRREQDSYGDYILEEDILTRHTVLLHTDGPIAARAYLEAHLEVDELRRIAVEDDIASGDFPHAEKLCLDCCNTSQCNPNTGPNQWNRLLYTIYLKSGNHEKLLAQARQLLMLGDLSYWQTLRDLLTADGVWQNERQPLLDAVQSTRPYADYMSILADECETRQLMNLVQMHPQTVFIYGAQLAVQYGPEIYLLCMAQIRTACSAAKNRNHYRNVCALIADLSKYGGIHEAHALIREFGSIYQYRPALLDELHQLEKKLPKK